MGSELPIAGTCRVNETFSLTFGREIPRNSLKWVIFLKACLPFQLSKWSLTENNPIERITCLTACDYFGLGFFMKFTISTAVDAPTNIDIYFVLWFLFWFCFWFWELSEHSHCIVKFKMSCWLNVPTYCQIY